MKINIKKLAGLFLIGFSLLNIVAYNHAYHFTHFSNIEGKRIKPENLSFGQKIKTVFLGIDNPKPFIKELPERDYVTIRLKSHEIIEGWYMEKKEPNGTVVLFHGYSGNKSGNLTYAKEFNRLGYSTLLMDFMGCGNSEGFQTTVGFKESRDVKVAFDFIKTKQATPHE